MRLDEGYGLDAGYVEALAAADVFAAYQVVAADHVALGFGEAGAVALVGAAAKLGFLAADEPGELILALLAAVRTGHEVGAGFGLLVEKITFFHRDLQHHAARVDDRCPGEARRTESDAPRESIAYWDGCAKASGRR